VAQADAEGSLQHVPGLVVVVVDVEGSHVQGRIGAAARVGPLSHNERRRLDLVACQPLDDQSLRVAHRPDRNSLRR